MIHAHVVPVKSINTAVEETHKQNNCFKVVRFVVELDQFKYELSTYDKPLVEVGDSL